MSSSCKGDETPFHTQDCGEFIVQHYDGYKLIQLKIPKFGRNKKTKTGSSSIYSPIYVVDISKKNIKRFLGRWKLNGNTYSRSFKNIKVSVSYSRTYKGAKNVKVYRGKKQVHDENTRGDTLYIDLSGRYISTRKPKRYSEDRVKYIKQYIEHVLNYHIENIQNPEKIIAMTLEDPINKDLHAGNYISCSACRRRNNQYKDGNSDNSDQDDIEDSIGCGVRGGKKKKKKKKKNQEKINSFYPYHHYSKIVVPKHRAHNSTNNNNNYYHQSDDIGLFMLPIDDN